MSDELKTEQTAIPAKAIEYIVSHVIPNVKFPMYKAPIPVQAIAYEMNFRIELNKILCRVFYELDIEPDNTYTGPSSTFLPITKSHVDREAPQYVIDALQQWFSEAMPQMLAETLSPPSPPAPEESTPPTE
jgi:hypothetical protein